MKVVKQQLATSVLAELIRNGIIDDETLATHFGVSGAEVDNIRYYQCGTIEVTFATEEQ